MCLNVRNVMKHLNPEVTVLMDMSLEQEEQNNAFDKMFVVEKVGVANYLIVHMEIGIARGFICEECDDIC